MAPGGVPKASGTDFWSHVGPKMASEIDKFAHVGGVCAIVFLMSCGPACGSSVPPLAWVFCSVAFVLPPLFLNTWPGGMREAIK